MMGKPSMWWPGLNRMHPMRGRLLAAYLFWEGSGSILHDATTNGWDGTFQSTMGNAWAGSEFGNVVDFPATDTDSHISVSADAPLMADDISYAFRVRPHTISGGHALINKFLAPWTDGFLIRQNNAELKMYVSNGTAKIAVAGYFVTDEWVSGVATLSTKGSPVQGRVYKNGVLVATENAYPSTSTSASPFQIGEQSNLGANWEGDIDYLYVFDFALEQPQVEWIRDNPYEMLRPSLMGIVEAGGGIAGAGGYIAFPHPRGVRGGTMAMAGGAHG